MDRSGCRIRNFAENLVNWLKMGCITPDEATLYVQAAQFEAQQLLAESERLDVPTTYRRSQELWCLGTVLKLQTKQALRQIEQLLEYQAKMKEAMAS